MNNNIYAGMYIMHWQQQATVGCFQTNLLKSLEIFKPDENYNHLAMVLRSIRLSYYDDIAKELWPNLKPNHCPNYDLVRSHAWTFPKTVFNTICTVHKNKTNFTL
jgi:hypothetical protein